MSESNGFFKRWRSPLFDEGEKKLTFQVDLIDHENVKKKLKDEFKNIGDIIDKINDGDIKDNLKTKMVGLNFLASFIIDNGLKCCLDKEFEKMEFEVDQINDSKLKDDLKVKLKEVSRLVNLIAGGSIKNDLKELEGQFNRITKKNIKDNLKNKCRALDKKYKNFVPWWRKSASVFLIIVLFFCGIIVSTWAVCYIRKEWCCEEKQEDPQVLAP